MTPITYFRSYPEPFYPDWRSEPVPGWGVRPVMAGPRMVAVGAFGDASKPMNFLPVVNDLANALAAEKNPGAAALDPNGAWRKQVRTRLVSIATKYSPNDAAAVANGISLLVKNKYGVVADFSSELSEARKRANIAKAFKSTIEQQKAAAEAEAAAKAAADEAASMQASMASSSKPVYKETWFLVAAGVAAMGVAYLLYTK